MAKRKYTDEQYEAHKDRTRKTQREKSEAGRDVAGTCPECADPATRDRVGIDLKFALETLFPCDSTWRGGRITWS